MTEPDWDRLTAINDELEALVDAGKATQAEYDRLLAEADKAVGEHSQFLEGILMRGMELGFVEPNEGEE